MIAFDLECQHGHIFEGWFENSKSFELQDKKNMISCPFCDDTNIRKVLSPVTMKTSPVRNGEKGGKSIDYRKLAREVVDYINNEFEDLGADFTKEALKMHYGVTEKRSIKGTASLEEEKVLEDEGVKFFKLPIPGIDEGEEN
ncbi:DUF1178 family protein [Thermodesulfobacteriota bacterium]